MRTELHPIVCWLTQESDEPYQESLDAVMDATRESAARYLYRYFPGNNSGRHAEWLVYSALEHLQNTILDQYLPVLDPGRPRVVSCVWPRWEKSRVLVRFKDGTLAEIAPPFPADEQHIKQNFFGEQYEYTFYRNDSPRQRIRWLQHEMKEWARQEGRREQPRRETGMSETMAIPTEDSFARDLENSDFLLKLRSIADPEDLKLALNPQKNEDAAARKRRQRAMQRLYAAGQIVLGVPGCDTARACFERLKSAGPKDRRHTLEEYFIRYAKETQQKWKD